MVFINFNECRHFSHHSDVFALWCRISIASIEMRSHTRWCENRNLGWDVNKLQHIQLNAKWLSSLHRIACRQWSSSHHIYHRYPGSMCGDELLRVTSALGQAIILQPHTHSLRATNEMKTLPFAHTQTYSDIRRKLSAAPNCENITRETW